ncbi:MAG: hypothetical protein D6677_01700 [Calditrichaeota bacterium]|nr:MAG: hypothetical protein D6677_01700 [Calditrichota bacterium]
MISRRDFLKNAAWAGVPIMAGLNACETVNSPEDNSNWRDDFNIMTEAARFEASTIVTYNTILTSGILNDAPEALQADLNALLFKNHHNEHLESFNEAFAEKNFDLVDTAGVSPDPRWGDVADWRDAIILALNMEFEAARFYFSRMTDQLTTTFVRKRFANVFPVEMSHAVAFKFMLGEQPAINAGLFENFSIASKL